MERAKTIQSIQFLRGFAALWVAWFHIVWWLKGNGAPEFLGNLASVGWVGVNIFFVISGYIMWSTTSDETSAGRFFYKRLTRIYTSLWPALLIFLVAGALKPQPADVDMDALIRSATLLTLEPTAELNHLYVTWTLTYELYFYLVFAAILAIGRRHAVIVLAVTVVVIEGTNFLSDVFKFDASPIFTDRSPYNFAIGCLAAAAVNLSRTARAGGLAAGLGLLCAGTYFGGWMERYDAFLFFGVGTGLVLMASPLIDELIDFGPLTRLGDWSYAMYLLHPSVIYLSEIGAFRWNLTQEYGYIPFLLLYSIAVVGLSAVYYAMVEQPLLRQSRRLYGLLARPRSTNALKCAGTPPGLPIDQGTRSLSDT
ncbi:MAG: acyltransferase [Chromatiaceae bacterium]|nr:acyltransferase [Chromatiaceae bacterium]